MTVIGLTGGIGAGKSAVAGLLAGHGAVVIDADTVAREVVAPGSAGLDQVVAAFGADVRTAEGSLDRARLAALVFTDDAARARLNSIVHPLIATRTAELVAAAPTGTVVVHDVPLLVENAMADRYDLVVVVQAPLPERLRRLAATRGMSEAAARARMAAQASDERRRAVADVVLDNAGDLADLAEAVDLLWQDHVLPLLTR
ncbi:MAG: dephospho-CoA kinase [Actinobacteria bacterium]|nr:dephospho-CoA kinase [Actinomycetota bacterium]